MTLQTHEYTLRLSYEEMLILETATAHLAASRRIRGNIRRDKQAPGQEAVDQLTKKTQELYSQVFACAHNPITITEGNIPKKSKIP